MASEEKKPPLPKLQVIKVDEASTSESENLHTVPTTEHSNQTSAKKTDATQDNTSNTKSTSDQDESSNKEPSTLSSLASKLERTASTLATTLTSFSTSSIASLDLGSTDTSAKAYIDPPQPKASAVMQPSPKPGASTISIAPATEISPIALPTALQGAWSQLKKKLRRGPLATSTPISKSEQPPTLSSNPTVSSASLDGDNVSAKAESLCNLSSSRSSLNEESLPQNLNDFLEYVLSHVTSHDRVDGVQNISGIRVFF